MPFVQGSGNGEWGYDLPKMWWRWNSGRDGYRSGASRATARAKRKFLSAWL